MSTYRLGLSALLCFGLVACSDGDGGDVVNQGDSAALSPESPSENLTNERRAATAQINATAGGFGAAADAPENRYTYFNLARGEVVELTDLEAMLSTDWHLGFKRTSIIANGGISGSGNVAVALADAAEDYYNADGSANPSVFLNTDPSAALSRFEAVSLSDQWRFATDEAVPAIASDGGEGSWWQYDTATHTLAARAQNWYIVRGAQGESFTKFHVAEIDPSNRQVVLVMQHQLPGESAFSSAGRWQVALAADQKSACFDIASNATVDCAAQAQSWDIQLHIPLGGRGAWQLWTNGGLRGEGSEGAAYGPLTASEQAEHVSAPSVHVFAHDQPSGVFKTEPFYAYNVQGSHKLWPNYRVYAVRADDQVYKVQLTSYYDATSGTSGVYTLRYQAFEQ